MFLYFAHLCCIFTVVNHQKMCYNKLAIEKNDKKPFFESGFLNCKKEVVYAL